MTETVSRELRIRLQLQGWICIRIFLKGPIWIPGFSEKSSIRAQPQATYRMRRHCGFSFIFLEQISIKEIFIFTIFLLIYLRTVPQSALLRSFFLLDTTRRDAGSGELTTTFNARGIIYCAIR